MAKLTMSLSFYDICKDTPSDSSLVESFIRACITMPLGMSMTLPKEFLPEKDNSNAKCCPLVYIRNTIHNSSLMNEKYKLDESETLVLLFKNNRWVVYHVLL